MKRVFLGSVILSVSLANAQPKPIDKTKELEDLLANTDKIAQNVVKGRGLSLLQPLTKQPIKQPEVRKKLLQEFDEDFAPGELEAEAIALKKLGMLSPDDDYRTILIDVLTEQIAGFYDPDQKALFLVEEVLPDRGALAHEICHALQDQHFDLNALHKKQEKLGADASFALSALIEGDAMGVLLDDSLNWRSSFAHIENLPNIMRKQMTARDERSKTLDAAPPIIQESLIFPYLEGVIFAYALRQTGSWEVIDKVFADLPTSTEQILHPEKYLKRDHPSEVPTFSLPSLSQTHAMFYETIFGEFQLRVWFKQALNPKDAAIAAKGWDGDRFLAFAPKRLTAKDLTKEDLDSIVIASVSTWDTETDAKEAASAFQKVAQTLLPGSLIFEDGSIATKDKLGTAQALVLQDKKTVLFVFGVSATVVLSLQNELQKASLAIVEK